MWDYSGVLAHAHTCEARRIGQISSSITSLFSEKGLSLTLESTDLALLAGHQPREILLFLPLQM